MERDTITGWLIGDTDISTHALTWSATIWYGLDNYTVADFNSRAHVERDWTCRNGEALKVDFNSRAHVERDALAPLQKSIDETNFNSRAHVERDFQVSNEWHY